MLTTKRGRPRREDLAERQIRVLALLDRGATNREIADALGITLDGAKYHIRELCEHFAVDTREEVVEAWRRRNGCRGRTGILHPGWRPRWALTGLGAAVALGVAVVAGVALSPRQGPAPAEVLYLAAVPAVDVALLDDMGATHVTTYDAFAARYDPAVTSAVLFDAADVAQFPQGAIENIFRAGVLVAAVNMQPRDLREVAGVLPGWALPAVPSQLQAALAETAQVHVPPDGGPFVTFFRLAPPGTCVSHSGAVWRIEAMQDRLALSRLATAGLSPGLAVARRDDDGVRSCGAPTS